MDCFWCSGRAAAALYNCSTFSSFSSNGEVPYRCSLFCALFLGLWFWYILQYLHFLQYTPRIMVYFAVSPFFTQQNSCLWFKTGCTVQLLIWNLKHNISIPPPTLVSSHQLSYLAAFPANPPHSGNVSYQAFFYISQHNPPLVSVLFMFSHIQRDPCCFFSRNIHCPAIAVLGATDTRNW